VSVRYGAGFLHARYRRLYGSESLARSCWGWIISISRAASFIQVCGWSFSPSKLLIRCLANLDTWEIGVDIKLGNILIDVEDVESVIDSHLKQSPENTHIHVTASNLRSEALVATDADSIANINVRIVDFGVGEWPTW
jgi:hypothetical protein